MSIPSMIVFHFDSALELMTDGMEHGLFRKGEMEQLIEACAQQCEYQTHEFMWRSLKRMLNQDTGGNITSLKPRGPDVH